jgi:hypothetical protein
VRPPANGSPGSTGRRPALLHEHTEGWAAGLRITHEAEQHLEQTVALARRINRPLLELGALAHLALATYLRSMPLGEERSNQAVELARMNGWSEDPFAGVATLYSEA